ncbi:hypothetical protein [Frigoribacterium sp. Leaf8]|uniref:hypothetical protein n=1 Tax=Frigoribacterium sp. Leaf8 TaxID=1735673 RepID=UPI000AC7C119|nr:hypothetical protein [Frigoribacterium sp. Leaf8]
MNDIRVVGFAADLLGNENAIFSADPVLDVEGTLFVAVNGRHESVSLREVTEDTLPYVHRLRTSPPVWHEAGQVVALIGPQLKQLVEGVHSLRGQADKLHDWHVASRGFSWNVMEREALADFRMTVRKAVRPLLLGSLRIRVEKTNGDAKAYFDLFSEFSPVEDIDYFLLRALYYQENNDPHALHLTAVFAVDTVPGIRSARQFYRKLRQLTSQLRAQQLEDEPAKNASAAPEAAFARAFGAMGGFSKNSSLLHPSGGAGNAHRSSSYPSLQLSQSERFELGKANNDAR